MKKALVDLNVAVREIADGEDIEEYEVDLQNKYIGALVGQGKHNNQSFFAFTATPKGETLEMFGTPHPYLDENGQPQMRKTPFHVYSMQQAIEEGFIVDVLKNYTTIQEAFRLVRVTQENPELIEGAAAKALFRYYKQHGYTIQQKTDMILSNFLSKGRFTIDGKGKAIIVSDSRANAVRYYLAIKDYLKSHPKESVGSDVMVAFSGSVEIDGIEYRESQMNVDENGKYITTDKKFRKVFNSPLYNILVVANKYQTGFDEPLLQSMYVDKKLKGVNAVQTLSRLNRTCFGKDEVFVLDFENTVDDIKDSFQPYFECTTLDGEVDINRVYDLRAKIQDYLLYNMEDVQKYRTLMDAQSKQKQTQTGLGRLSAILKPVVDRFSELEEDGQYAARDYLRKFNNAYSYVTQLVKLHDEELFNEYLFTSQLVKFLPRTSKDIVDIDDKISLEYASLKETFSGSIKLDNASVKLVPTSNLAPKKPNKKKDTLQSIIDKVNEKYLGDFTDGDKVIVKGLYEMFMSDPEVKSKIKDQAKGSNTEMFINSLFPDKFQEIATRCYTQSAESFNKLFTDADFYKNVMNVMASIFYKELRKD